MLQHLAERGDGHVVGDSDSLLVESEYRELNNKLQESVEFDGLTLVRSICVIVHTGYKGGKLSPGDHTDVHVMLFQQLTELLSLHCFVAEVLKMAALALHHSCVIMSPYTRIGVPLEQELKQWRIPL